MKTTTGILFILTLTLVPGIAPAAVRAEEPPAQSVSPPVAPNIDTNKAERSPAMPSTGDKLASKAGEEHGLTTVFLSRGWHEYLTYSSTFSEKPFDVRITPVLDCCWGARYGNKKMEDCWPGIKDTNWLTIRWVGFVQAGKAGTYTFRIGGGRLMMDGKLLANPFYDRGGHYYDADVEMKADEKKEVVVEGWTWVGGGFRLMWKPPGKDDFEVIPSSALYPCPKEESPTSVAAPKIESKSGFAGDRSYALITSADGTYVHYTLDGSEPTRLHGALYFAPVAIVKSGALKARSFLPNGGQSQVVEQAFTVKETPLKEGVRIFRTGNSFTANAQVYLQQIEAAGGFKQFSKDTIGAGTTTKYLWENKVSGVPKDNTPYDHQVIPGDARKLVQDNAPFDAYITQPFYTTNTAPAMAEEVEYTGKFFDLVLAGNPKADLWIYAQWMPWSLPGDVDMTNGSVRPKETGSKEWREAMEKYIVSCEQLREQLQAKYPGNKVRILPCASALLALQKEIEDGKISGMKSYPMEITSDSLHLGHKGCYLVGLVHFACLYGKSPVGLVVDDTTLTIEQQTRMQEIAWETVKNYRWAGLNKE